MHPRKFIRDSIGFVFTQYVVRAALMMRGLIAARLLGPQAYGQWNALQLLMDYGVFAPVGTQQGLDQAVPPRMVANDSAGLRSVTRAGLFNILTLTLLFIGGVYLWAGHGAGRILNAWGYLGLSLAMGCILLTNIGYYMLTIMRSHGDISSVSRWYFIQAVIGSAVGLGGIWRFGPWALLWGWFLGTLIATIVAHFPSRHIAPLTPMPSADSRRLIQVGLPMFVYTSSSLVMRSVDRLIVLPTLGTASLGLYSLTVMALTFLLYLPDSITYVLYPQLLRRYSEGGAKPEAIHATVDRVVKGMAIFVPLLCGIAYLFAREAVSLLLPKFIPGVAALRVLCFGAVGLAVSNLASVVLMTVGRQMLLVPAALIATAVGAALDIAAVRLGHGITGVAWATFFTYVVNGSIMLGMAFRGLGESARGVAAALFRSFMPLVLSILLAYALDRYLPWSVPPNNLYRVLRLLLATVLFIPLYAGACVPFSQGLGLRQLVSEFNLPVLGPVLRRILGSPKS